MILIIFDVNHVYFKVFVEFITILFPFYVLVLGHEACGILAP